jgi:hypothetical protein
VGGGIPWTLAPNPNLVHELVVGLGSDRPFVHVGLFGKMAKLFLPDGRIVAVAPQREHFTVAEVSELAAKWCHLIRVPPHGCLYANVDGENLPRNENVVAELHLDGMTIYGPALLLTPTEWKELRF